LPALKNGMCFSVTSTLPPVRRDVVADRFRVDRIDGWQRRAATDPTQSWFRALLIDATAA
jgi:hypothetical protein